MSFPLKNDDDEAHLHQEQAMDMDASQMSATSQVGSPPATQGRKSRRRRNINLILAALCLVAAALVLTTSFLLRSSEKIEFETAFKIFARETAVVAEMHAENVFGQLQSLASAVRSGMPDVDSNEEGFLHEVSINDFDLRTEEIANLTGIELLMFVPFVPYQERRSWENFQLLNQEWVLEGYKHRGWNTSHLKTIPREIYNYTLPSAYNDTRRGFIDKDGFMEGILGNHTTCNKETTGACSVPVAQVGPRLIDTSIVMMDLFSHPIFKKEIIASLEYDVPVISEVEDLEFLLKHLQPTDASSLQEGRDYSLPRSFTLDQVKADVGEGSVTVGFVVGVVQWNAFFRNFLHSSPNTNGIIVNVSSDCGKSFNYVVNAGRKDEWYNLDGDGEVVELDRKYQHLEQTYKFFWKEHPKGTSRHCHFDLLITPSEEFAQEYMTNTPFIWAGIVLAIFVGIGAAFLIYEHYNYRQQRTIKMEKDRAEAVVTSLFPEQIGARMIEEQSLTNNESHVSAKRQRDIEWQAQTREARAKPMAELYPSASIMFADIVGFTAWSSKKEPSEVFTLLETIYHAFDSIAQRRRVFKIETIGDCYVAVCGLPKPRDNHAVVLARFAQNCLDKFRELVTELDEDLPGTAALDLRTGLHSGAVTAGVLRGDRARFQLFGDTVNTTARVETTGKGGKIHVSREFSNELIKFNKGSWVSPRNERVEAKGKGTLTTFWLQVPDIAPSETAPLSSIDDSARMPDESARMPTIMDDIDSANVYSNPSTIETPKNVSRPIEKFENEVDV